MVLQSASADCCKVKHAHLKTLQKKLGGIYELLNHFKRSFTRGWQTLASKPIMWWYNNQLPNSAPIIPNTGRWHRHGRLKTPSTLAMWQVFHHKVPHPAPSPKNIAKWWFLHGFQIKCWSQMESVAFTIAWMLEDTLCHHTMYTTQFHPLCQCVNC